ncbi:MAG TPA: protein translocase subunit SecD, partial [Bryobacteraceae bacterium]|nr:protein translocase subunit SecD [Bryobacteraceae bacterium]
AQVTAARLKDEMSKAAIDGNVAVIEAAKFDDAQQAGIRVSGVSLDARPKLRSLIKDQFPAWTPLETASDFRLSLRSAEAIRLRQQVLDQTSHVIANKINALGLSEATEQIAGDPRDARILVEMPGADDSTRIKRILGTAAVLEWLDVKDGPFPTCDAALAAHGGLLPLNTQLLDGGKRNGRSVGCYLLARNAVIKGADIRDAHPAQNPAGGWVTIFVLSQDAAKRFEPYTASNIGNRAAIVLDRQIVEVAEIHEKIRDTGQITGITNQQDAFDLALNLRAGALPARVEFGEEYTVGPSLGADSICDGMRASAAGLAAVVTVMCVYYKGSGVNATIALLLNAIILVAALSYFGAVLTLPGIAGVILTIGMAVDSNVLIFERIREELREGKSAVAAVETGFRKALSSIIDTHVTTVVACACLFLFGTGPVKGFAVTLVIGLVANVFTAVFVSKTLFDWKLARSPAPKLSI